jgi:hypothetical protein
MAFNLFEAPEYYQGLLGEEETKKLQGRAMTTGLVNAAIGYLAQPKTMGYGSALPYIGRALAGGLQSGQETIRSGLQDYETQQKLAEMKRKQGQQQRMQDMLGGITDPNERLLAELAPEQYVASKLKPKERKVEKIGNQIVDITGDTPNVLFTGEKELKAPPTRERQVGRTKIQEELQADGTWKEIGKGAMDAPKAPEKIGYSVQTDSKTGNIVYVPDRPGSPVLDVSGKPTTYTPAGKEKPATDAQNAASGFLDRMASSSAIINAPAVGEDGKPILDPKTKRPLTLEEVAGRPEKFAQLYRNIPGLSTLGNVVESPLRQQYRQAQENWVRANLRKESGAAIGVDEMQAEIATYFPQIGDSDQQIKQKSDSRKVTENAMRKSAGVAGSPVQQNVSEKPKSKVFTLDNGTQVGATLGADGNYYVTKGNKKFKVEE